MIILLTHEEILILELATAFQQRVYILGIRKYMDYDTGYVGARTPISYGILANRIEKGVEGARHKIRKAVDRLISLDLLDKQITGQKMTFFCKMAQIRGQKKYNFDPKTVGAVRAQFIHRRVVVESRTYDTYPQNEGADRAQLKNNIIYNKNIYTNNLGNIFSQDRIAHSQGERRNTNLKNISQIIKNLSDEKEQDEHEDE